MIQKYKKYESIFFSSTKDYRGKYEEDWNKENALFAKLKLKAVLPSISTASIHSFDNYVHCTVFLLLLLGTQQLSKQRQVCLECTYGC